MVEFIAKYQLDIMQLLSGVCAVVAILLFITKALTARRRQILILMQLAAMLLLIFDRMAYVYSGDVSQVGFIMVRLSNFIVFFLTSGVVFIFNLYVIDLLTDEGELKEIPKRLKIVSILSSIGMVLVVISQFTGLFYTIDANNVYHRAPLFILCYIIPVVGPILQYTVIIKHRDRFAKPIYLSLNLYLIVPVIASIIQVFAYGISITNACIVLVSVFMYISTYYDINDKVNRAHEIEMRHLKQEQRTMKHLFEQTVTSFVEALEERDPFSKGHSSRVADYAKKLAGYAGLSEKECEDVYYAALLHDVGKIGLADNILENGDKLTSEERETFKKKQLIGSSILEKISEYPELAAGAHYVKERYDGTGYPEGLKGEEIPKIARVIAVADAYDRMTSRSSYSTPLPDLIVREEFIKGAGTVFDPDYTHAILRLIDANAFGNVSTGIDEEEEADVNELHCGNYRDAISKGIMVDTVKTIIDFYADPEGDHLGKFSHPSIILFDAYDARVHNEARTITAYNYKEYGELWFDGNYVCTAARNMEVSVTKIPKNEDTDGNDHAYKITAVRLGDHVKIKLVSDTHQVEAVVALLNSTAWAYIGITGENCHIRDITINKTEETLGEGDIKRIADEINYIDRIESDVPNIQINGNRSVSTPGIPVRDGMSLMFHTMSLPMANLVWHCPYIILFYSADGKVNGPDYREYALIKLNGEDNGSKDYVNNAFTMKKSDKFAGWEVWKARNKEGLECVVDFTRKGKKISLSTENLYIDIKNVSTIKDDPEEVYVALTGDEVALTDIRVI